jgi:hypothetical protein
MTDKEASRFGLTSGRTEHKGNVRELRQSFYIRSRVVKKPEISTRSLATGSTELIPLGTRLSRQAIVDKNDYFLARQIK